MLELQRLIKEVESVLDEKVAQDAIHYYEVTANDGRIEVVLGKHNIESATHYTAAMLEETTACQFIIKKSFDYLEDDLRTIKGIRWEYKRC